MKWRKVATEQSIKMDFRLPVESTPEALVASTRRSLDALVGADTPIALAGLMRLEVADVLDEQLNVDADGLEAAHVLRLRQIALRAVGETRAPVGLARKVEVDLLHLTLQALFGLLLSDGTTRMPMRCGSRGSACR